MASQDTFHCLTFSLISLVTLLILILPSTQATSHASISAVFTNGALLPYNILMSLTSQLCLSLEHIIRRLYQDRHGAMVNQIVLLLSFFMSCGWIVNAAFWTHCEIYETNRKVCPLKTRRSYDDPLSTTKVVLGWTVTVVYIVYTFLASNEVSKDERKWHSSGVTGGKEQEMVEDDVTSDENMFQKDLASAGKRCV